jgi:type II secretory pathway component GspD/PulD (secretin)
MKSISPILLAGLIAGSFANTAATAGGAPQEAEPLAVAPPPAEQTAQPANPATKPAAAAPTARASNTGPTTTTTDQGLMTLNWRGVTVDQALTMLSEAAGLTINRMTSTSSAGVVDLVSAKPLSKDEVVALFNKVLADHDLAAIQDGKVLNIMTTEMASEDAATPVGIVTNWADIPNDAEEVTWVIPVHSLNPKQVLTDLYTLIPPDAKMNSSDAGTSVIMTGRQMDVRRLAQIITALDSTGNGDLEVFLLKYADSKALASELKDVFAPDTAGAQSGFVNPFAVLLGLGGRGRAVGGGGGGGAAAADPSKRTGARVNAVSDDENNAVLVSAPADFMPGISNIITALDIPQMDTVQIRLFFLTNADCTDVANELLALFPDPNQSSQNQNNGRRGAAQFGGGFGGFGGRGGGAPAASGMSDRLKKQATVNAVPDPRTQSILVTASKDTMTQIEQMIEQLDADKRGHVKVFVYKPAHANVLDFVGPMTDLFQQNGRSTSTSTQLNALQQRMQQAAQQNTINASSSVGTSGGGMTTP